MSTKHLSPVANTVLLCYDNVTVRCFIPATQRHTHILKTKIKKWKYMHKCKKKHSLEVILWSEDQQTCSNTPKKTTFSTSGCHVQHTHIAARLSHPSSTSAHQVMMWIVSGWGSGRADWADTTADIQKLRAFGLSACGAGPTGWQQQPRSGKPFGWSGNYWPPMAPGMERKHSALQIGGLSARFISNLTRKISEAYKYGRDVDQCIWNMLVHRGSTVPSLVNSQENEKKSDQRCQIWVGKPNRNTRGQKEDLRKRKAFICRRVCLQVQRDTARLYV